MELVKSIIDYEDGNIKREEHLYRVKSTNFCIEKIVIANKKNLYEIRGLKGVCFLDCDDINELKDLLNSLEFD